ncbi:MAG: hypothetical protein E6R13_01550 [Spirochaetes bacterium]|nr:MAG: hypothetical protein E6R13_01550 [Spirochaetota bacterium]
MSRARDLRNSPENNLNLFDLFSMFSIDGKTKYTEMLLRLMKSTPNIDQHVKEIKTHLTNELNIKKSDLDLIPDIQLILFFKMVDNLFNLSDLKSFQKFCEYNERGLIKENDVSKYSDFEQIINAVSNADLVLEAKSLEKQVNILFDNDEWLILRPLTYESSKKYGANTKWCTKLEDTPDYFMKYTHRGVLIYCINKKENFKVASFYSLDKREPEFSFWDQKDNRIDSLESGLPSELRDLIAKVSLDPHAKPNRLLLSMDEKTKEEKSLSRYRLDFNAYQIPQTSTTESRISRISQALGDGDVYNTNILFNDDQPSLQTYSDNLFRVNDDTPQTPPPNYWETEGFLTQSRLIDINSTPNDDGAYNI